MPSNKPPIVNLADIELKPFPAPASGAAAERFEARFGYISPAIGAQKLWDGE
jgi:hypothetical protein